MTQSPDTHAGALERSILDGCQSVHVDGAYYVKLEDVIRQALIKPEGEPVAWRLTSPMGHIDYYDNFEAADFKRRVAFNGSATVEPLFASPVSPKETQDTRDEVHALLVNAYHQGALDVHNEARKDPECLVDTDPDFTEAANDRLISANQLLERARYHEGVAELHRQSANAEYDRVLNLRDALSKCQKLLHELSRPDANKPYNSMTFWAKCVEAETYARSILEATK